MGDGGVGSPEGEIPDSHPFTTPVILGAGSLLSALLAVASVQLLLAAAAIVLGVWALATRGAAIRRTTQVGGVATTGRAASTVAAVLGWLGLAIAFLGLVAFGLFLYVLSHAHLDW